MALKDIKNKIDKLENILNTNVVTPAQWAFDVVRVWDQICANIFDENGRLINPKTEEDIYQEALKLTRKYGTKERMIEARIEQFKNGPEIDLESYL